tara:strand:- start:753 stop:998 length:246 start_codon:yes stop_codon:yes gene_type:complete
MQTDGGIELTEKQKKCIESFSRLMKKWDKDLCINAIAGQLTIMLLGGTEQNPISEMSDTGGFNDKNIIISYYDIFADGGDW